MRSTRMMIPKAKRVLPVLISLILLGFLSRMGYRILHNTRNNSKRAACISNLKVISSKAEIYSFNHPETTTFTMETLGPVFDNTSQLSCMEGGTYSLNDDTPPKAVCSYGDGHRL